MVVMPVLTSQSSLLSSPDSKDSPSLALKTLQMCLETKQVRAEWQSRHSKERLSKNKAWTSRAIISSPKVQ